MSIGQGISCHMTCGLKVDTQNKGWAKTMKKILGKISGVSYDLDAEEGMIYITGKVNPTAILSTMAKYEKHAELCWMRTGNQYYMYGGNHHHVMDGTTSGHGHGHGVPYDHHPYGYELPSMSYHLPYYPRGSYEPLHLPAAAPPPPFGYLPPPLPYNY